MKQHKQGITFIELLIVMAIIGILASLAIPQYQKFVAKSQVARAINESSSARVKIELCIVNGLFTVGKASLGQCDTQAIGSSILVGPSQGDNVFPATPAVGAPQASIDAADNTAEVIATFGNSASTAITGDTITWARDSDGTWTCFTTILAKYDTAGCDLF